MGNAWTGKPAQQVGMTNNFDPETMARFSKFAEEGPGGGNPLSQNPLYQQTAQTASRFQQPFDPGQFEQLFQQGIANPTIRNYQQQVLPAIANRFMDQSNIYGSGLNQALAQSANELTGNLGELRARHQGQAQESHENRALQAMMQSLGIAQAPGQEQSNWYNQLFNANAHSPITEGHQSGWLKDLTELAVQLAGAAVPFGPGVQGLPPEAPSQTGQQRAQANSGYQAPQGNNFSPYISQQNPSNPWQQTGNTWGR